MDAQRFDNLAKSLAGRLSRRNALRRAGAAASATLLASAGVRAAPTVAQGQDEPAYTVIRRYSLDNPAERVRAALQRGYIEDACKAPGFIAYFAVEDEDGDFATVAVFRSQDDFEEFATAEANWIAQNLGDLLPAPDEALSGDTYVYAGAAQALRNTCPAATQQTAGPPQPLPAPPLPGARRDAHSGAVHGPGVRLLDRDAATMRPGFICCPTSDVPGGPGVCQTQEVCYPNQCVENGGACDPSCGADDACPSCCSNYCNDSGQCADAPAPPCTAAGCDCTTGTQAPCDAGLICCGTTDTPGGPGTCQTEAECNPPCTARAARATVGCRATVTRDWSAVRVEQPIPGGAGTCEPEAECAPAPCTGQGCDCNGGVQGACDTGAGLLPGRRVDSRWGRDVSTRGPVRACHPAPARAVSAPVVSRGTAMPGWSAARTGRKSRVGPAPALPRRTARLRPARVRAAPVTAGSRAPATRASSAA